MPVDDVHYRVFFDFIEDDYGYGILMSLGENRVCVSPTHVREELARRLKRAMCANQTT